MEIPGSLGRMPGGYPTLAGGTRSKIKLGRSFQMPLDGIVNPKTCNFCNMTAEKIAEETYPIPGVTEPAGWRRLKNIFTPHPNHRLIIPKTCWSVSDLQEWGGMVNLYTAIKMAVAEVGDDTEKVLLVNVGMQAGQNIGHPHMHVFTCLPEDPMSRPEIEAIRQEEVTVISDMTFGVYAAGGRSGECQIVPHDPFLNLRKCKGAIHALASTITHLVKIANRAFLSEPVGVLVDTGTEQTIVPGTLKTADQMKPLNDRAGWLKFELRQLPPAWSLTIRIAGDGTLRYASYTPDLHCVGALERGPSLLERVPMTLPWQHEVTAEHLRNHR